MASTPPKNGESPSAAPLSAEQQHPHRQSQRQTRSDFDLEPNPFEQSFSRPSHIRHTSASRRDSASPASNHSSRASQPDRPPSASSISHPKNDAGRSSPRTVLPPVAAIASPSDQSYNWQFSTSLANSLRAGPLSPAMLAGPQQGSDTAPHLPFDPASFRTGLTPRSGLTPRTGLTPGTGLTPLVGGPVSFPPPSPNTAAFLALMNNSSNSANATITPNTLSAINGVLGNSSNQYTAATHAPATSSHLSNSVTANQDNDTAYIGANNAASTAANGLYLLSQAHQELTKREEAQARANGTAAVSANGRRGTKRKSYDTASPSPPTTRAAVLQTTHIKRTRANTVNSASTGRGRDSGEEEEEEEEEEEDDDDEEMVHSQRYQQSQSQTGGTKTKQRKPETEEEKRRNFLERNRQAALKCRQRKKAWLASLQAKVEYLTTENERLTSALVSSREEISRLSALVGNAVIGPGGATVVSGVIPSNAVNGAVSNGQPVSMSINMASKGGAGGAATARASYGY